MATRGRKTSSESATRDFPALTDASGHEFILFSFDPNDLLERLSLFYQERKDSITINSEMVAVFD